MSDLYYIYGIVASSEIDVALTQNGLSVIYDLVSEEEFGQEAIQVNLKNMDWVNEKVLNHQNRLNDISKDFTVVPLKFGSIFKSEDSILKMLSERQDEFRSLLNKFEKKQEWGLKLYYEESKLVDWLTENSEELRSLDQHIQSLNSGSAFLLKKKKEEELKQLVKVTLNDERKGVHKHLSNISSDVRLNKELDQKLTGKKEENFLNITLLLSPEEAHMVRSYQEKVSKSFYVKGILLELSGPWPPYSFVSNG